MSTSTPEVEVKGSFNVSTEIAFIQRFMQMGDIPLADFMAIHNRALAYLNSLKNGYSDCSVRFQPEYEEFWNPWNGGFSLEFSQVKNSLEYLSKTKPELEQALTDLPADILDADISVLMDNKELRDINSTVWAETREHFNSVFKRYNVPVTARKWFSDRLEKATKRIAFLESIKDKTQSEMEDQYGYSFGDLERVFSMLCKEAETETGFGAAIYNVSQQLDGGKEVRAYLSFVLSVIHAWIDGLPLEHWFNVVGEHYKWKKEQYDGLSA